MKTPSRIRWLTLLILLNGCPEEPEPDPPGDDDTADLEPESAEQLEHWCDAVLGGVAGEGDWEADFSRAHGSFKLFGPSTEYIELDADLVDLLESGEPFTASLLEDYALISESVCAVEPGDGTLGAATAELEGDVAIVVPGTGTVDLPDGTAVVVVDARDLPATADADAALDAAVGLALSDDVSIGGLEVRTFSGFPMQWGSLGIYTFGAETLAGQVVATGDEELPLVFWTGPQLGAHAAEVIGGLRVAGRAWIVGYDVFAAVAESRWNGVGERGLQWRTGVWSTASNAAAPWPDRVPADVGTTTPERLLDDIAGWTLPDPLDPGAADRELMGTWALNPKQPLTELSLGAARAMLIVAHGLFERFYPYFEVVGHHTDEALLAGLDEIDTIDVEDRRAVLGVLGHFMHELHDGHGFYGDWATEEVPTGYLALQIQRVDGRAVIRASDHDDVLAGDTIAAVDGTPADEWYDEAMSRYSAASDGYRFDLATRELKEVWDSRVLALVDPDGVERTETPEPRPYEDTLVVPWGGTYRPHGWLDDLGAPGLYYLNLNGDYCQNWADIQPHISLMQDAEGLVVDMRDYPTVNHYTVVEYLMTEGYTSALFGIPTWTGAEQYELVSEHYDFTPATSHFEGPIALMVSNKTVSAAENFSMMLVGRPGLTVVGQNSASTNGNVTGAYLPGGYYMKFTGMDILFPDGSLFHGVGIVPDIEVVPTPEQFRDGIDPELAAAIGVL